MALGANPAIGRLAALVGAARGNALQVGLPPNPSVGYEGQQLGSGGLAEQNGVLFSQEIVRGGKLRLNRAVADRERMRVEQQLAAEELRVLTAVRIAYYQVLLAERQIELTADLLQVGEQGSTTVEKLFQAEEVGRADVLQSKLEVENARILRQNARNRRDAAWRSLTASIGNPELPIQPLAGSVDAQPQVLTFDESLARLLQFSPEVAAAAMEIERARLFLERARVEPTPNVNFQGLVNWQDNGIGGKPDGGVAVSIPIPVFNRNQGAIAQAEHELMAARQALNELELNLQRRLAETFERYANARSQVERYRQEILPAADESLQLTRTLYSSGETNYTTLLTSQRTYSQTHLNYLDAVLSLRVAEVEIEGLLCGSQQPAVPAGTPVIGATSSPPIGGLELFK
ncbi:MAG: TolC family protein [Planctomycetaceae bacterium]|nr:TolC family protein [Planctomycetaceae bacterium]